MSSREGLAPTPAYLIRQKTDFSWVKSLRPEPRTDEEDSEQSNTLSWAEVSSASESSGPGCCFLGLLSPLHGTRELYLQRHQCPRWAVEMVQWSRRKHPHPGELGALRSGHPETHPACNAAGHLPAPKYRQSGLSGRTRPQRRYPGMRWRSREDLGATETGMRVREDRAPKLQLTWFRSVYSDVICSNSSRV